MLRGRGPIWPRPVRHLAEVGQIGWRPGHGLGLGRPWDRRIPCRRNSWDHRSPGGRRTMGSPNPMTSAGFGSSLGRPGVNFGLASGRFGVDPTQPGSTLGQASTWGRTLGSNTGGQLGVNMGYQHMGSVWSVVGVWSGPGVDLWICGRPGADPGGGSEVDLRPTRGDPGAIWGVPRSVGPLLVWGSAAPGPNAVRRPLPAGTPQGLLPGGGDDHLVRARALGLGRRRGRRLGGPLPLRGLRTRPARARRGNRRPGGVLAASSAGQPLP